MAPLSQKGGKPTVVRPLQTSKFKTTLAVALWLSAIHTVTILNFLVLFVLPVRWSLMLLIVLATLVIVPLYEKSPIAIRVAKFICKHSPSHFPLTLVMEDKDAFVPNQTYLFAVEPHSVLPIGILALCGYTGYLPVNKTKALASSAVFFTPFLRHIWSWLGLVPASRKMVLSCLSDGYSCILIPGGVREILFMEHDYEVAYLKQRFGFVRIAIETGSPLVPCFIFGQTKVYNWWKPKWGKLYDRVCRALRFVPLVFWGMSGSPVPFRRPMYAVVGKPIQVKRNPCPSQEEVREVHKAFISSLEDLYEKHKVDAGYQEVSLNIF